MLNHSNKNRGFTLLELLVAISIFSVLSVMAYSGLQTVIKTKNITQQSSERIAELQLVMYRVTDDLRQVVARNIRNEFGDSIPAMQFNNIDDEGLEWSRAGYRNPAHLKRSNLQRIAYKVKDETLVRTTWNVLDRAQDTESFDNIMLSKVVSLEWRFLNHEDNWVNEWPAEVQNAVIIPLPKAVELNLELEDLGKIRRLILMVDSE